MSKANRRSIVSACGSQCIHMRHSGLEPRPAKGPESDEVTGRERGAAMGPESDEAPCRARGAAVGSEKNSPTCPERGSTAAGSCKELIRVSFIGACP